MPTLADVHRAACAEKVRRGNLSHLLHADQRRVLAQMRACPQQQFVLEIARRWGKSWLMCAIAIEDCLRYPRSRIAYGSSTSKSLQEYILPTIAAITENFPESHKPRWDAMDSHWTFPNGSWIHLFGCEDMLKARRGRGPPARRVFLDEAGFIPIMGDVVESVLRPQLMHLPIEETGCSVVLGSSPAEEPDHQFTAAAEVAEANGAFARRTIHDNPLLTKAQVENYIRLGAEAVGLTVEDYQRTDAFRREYMAERVVNKLLVVVPEWEAARESCIVAVERPPFFDGQVVLDFGGNDPHAATLGYWHFDRAAYVIEHEVLLRDGQNTQELVQALKDIERATWGTDRWDGTMRALMEGDGPVSTNLPPWLHAQWKREAPQQPRVRWADNDLQLCRDLSELHGYSVFPTEKDNKELQVNRLRLLIQERKLLLHPRCVHTDRHLRGTVWKDSKRTDYARKAGEHGDLLDCLVYGTRNLNRQRNPYPAGWGQQNGVRIREAPKPNLAAQVGRALRG